MKKLFFGLLLCFGMNAFGMNKVPSKISFWRKQWLKEAYQLRLKNPELYADEQAIKGAMHYLDEATDELWDSGRWMLAIENYNSCKSKFDALERNLVSLHSHSKMLLDRLENIKKKSD